MIDPSLRDLYQEVKKVRGLACAFYPLAMGEMVTAFPRPEDNKGIAGGKPISHAHERCDARLTPMRSGV
ncbi:MAG: hypothetical protein ACLQFI_15600 [Methylocella sp.]